MGAASSCCHQEETLGDILPVEDPQKVGGYNTHQKIIELKAYRFFLNHLITSMLVNNGIEKQDFYNNLRYRNTAIENIIKFASKKDATPKNIYIIAKSFYDNSIHDNFYENENEFIQDTMKYIFETCVITYYTICEKEVKKA